jgi:chromosome segregation ATPase
LTQERELRARESGRDRERITQSRLEAEQTRQALHESLEKLRRALSEVSGRPPLRVQDPDLLRENARLSTIAARLDTELEARLRELAELRKRLEEVGQRQVEDREAAIRTALAGDQKESLRAIEEKSFRIKALEGRVRELTLALKTEAEKRESFRAALEGKERQLLTERERLREKESEARHLAGELGSLREILRQSRKDREELIALSERRANEHERTIQRLGEEIRELRGKLKHTRAKPSTTRTDHPRPSGGPGYPGEAFPRLEELGKLGALSAQLAQERRKLEEAAVFLKGPREANELRVVPQADSVSSPELAADEPLGVQSQIRSINTARAVDS